MGRDLSSTALVVLGALFALCPTGCARTIHFNVTASDRVLATITVLQEEPTFELFAIDGQAEYSTEDGGSQPFAADFARVKVYVMPGTHEVTLMCRYEVGSSFRYSSLGRHSARQYAELQVTKKVSLQSEQETVLSFDDVCPEDLPCQGEDCGD